MIKTKLSHQKEGKAIGGHVPFPQTILAIVNRNNERLDDSQPFSFILEIYIDREE